MRESEVNDRPPRTDDATAGRLFVIALCGGGDRPIAALGGLTPFEAAPTPTLDALALLGSSGLLEVIGPDIPPESDSGAMALLGYDPMVHYTGRGPLEGLGMDFWLADGSSTAFRINFASWDPTTGRLDRRTSRDLSDEELGQLVTQLRDEVRLDEAVTVRLTGFGRHRGILAFTSTSLELSGMVSNTDPGFANVGPFGIPVKVPEATPLVCRPLIAGTAAATTARLVNEFVEHSAAVLERSEVNRRRRERGRRPANLILVRDGGDSLPSLPPFRASLSMYGQVPAERGLATLIGARFTVAKTGPGETDAAFYAGLVPTLLAERDRVVFVHLKGPDEPGHDGRPHDKVAAIAEIDEHFLGPLHRGLTSADTLVVTCDHATPCEVGLHAPDRVPTVVVGPGIDRDGVEVFSEGAAAAGGLGVKRSSELLAWLNDGRMGSGP
jgi:2,3-bisphosphoglycerate-independent phosphoglycerate mutase